jgi:hypothetical protein
MGYILLNIRTIANGVKKVKRKEVVAANGVFLGALKKPVTIANHRTQGLPNAKHEK